MYLISRKLKKRPKPGECKPAPEMPAFCQFHFQLMAACEQMAYGNLCHLCAEWHKRDFDCQKAQTEYTSEKEVI